ncbi:MAG: hypothetical protein QNK05_15475 [Myxococcota bacterium]|nr:hypothetical protein [Myxococcota bacterium]
MQRYCIFHAGCPDGFGAAWAVWKAWGEQARYIPRGHDDPLRAKDFEGGLVAFVDIAPPPRSLARLGESAAHLVVLDHHVTSRDRTLARSDEVRALEEEGHLLHFDLGHSGAVLAWQHFHPDVPTPKLLQYVEDQDLWTWKLPMTREVNAAISATPRTFDDWDRLAAASVDELAAEGAPIVRSWKIEVERALQGAHPIQVGGHRIEAVNARELRSLIGHELATRARHGVPVGAVYRLTGRRVDVSIYSVDDYDVGALATKEGGGGHRSAAGFSVTIEDWLERFV